MSGRWGLAWLLLLVMGSTVRAAPVPVRPSMVDSFQLGEGGDTPCRVQRSATDRVAAGLFDRAYAIVCRDAASPVGRLYALRTGRDDPIARLDAARGTALRCTAMPDAALADAGAAAVRRCTGTEGLGYDVLSVRRERIVFIAEGLAGYRSALDLGLRSLIADRVLPGAVTIARTGAGDATSFARAQAGSLDPALALSEGYRRNNAGSYAEASEFFDTLVQRTSAAAGEGADKARIAEYLVNRALQQSDLGNVDEANALFAQVDRLPTSNPLELRLRRNYRAIHLLNQRRLVEARAALDAPLDVAGTPSAAASEIDVDTAIALDDRSPLLASLGSNRSADLTPAEKIALFDAQAEALRGTIARLSGQPREAGGHLAAAAAALDQIRGGRVTSVARLRAQVVTEQAVLAEAAGRQPESERLYKEAVLLVGSEYPASLVLDAAQARLAGYYVRQRREAEAIALYREVVSALGAAGGASSGFADLLDPYFALLAGRDDPVSLADLFTAGQVLLRPGVADTQATLARELSGGSGEAARLFRQSLNEARASGALRVELNRLRALARPVDAERAQLAADEEQLASLEKEQSTTQARLAGFPAYRAIATQSLSLPELRAALKPGEGYWKLSVVGRSIYGLLVTATGGRSWRVALTPEQLATRVDALRATIAGVDGGRPATFPFDATGARSLYVTLAGPAALDLPALSHLIFEPDGAMQRLPAGLLIVAQPGLDRYFARQRQPGADPYDLTGIDWLGARVGLSVALSARAFRDVRATPPSQAAHAYLGFGRNAPVPVFAQLTGYTPPSGTIDCRWPLAAWDHPIAAAELVAAQQRVGAGNAALVTDAAFSDSSIVARDDLAGYRILHFATHGLVTAPRPECPATPALLTSFGTQGSDGLLGFGEIFALHLDADLVLLSACDTAGSADVAATRAVGVGTGGGNALDGLVRAFIGAGARSVLASHWPAPDDYGATEHLIEGLFTAPPGTSIAEALRQSERRLMADPATSHPYYWAGFALVGDGAKPVMPAR